jgi:hypothetical protein
MSLSPSYNIFDSVNVDENEHTYEHTFHDDVLSHIITGTQFNAIQRGNVMVVVSNANDCIREFKCLTGMNHDKNFLDDLSQSPQPNSPFPYYRESRLHMIHSGDKYSKSGLYFCPENDMIPHVATGRYVRTVTVPSDAWVHIQRDGYFRASKLILSNPTTVETYGKLAELYERRCVGDPSYLRFVPLKFQTERLCLAACTQDGLVLQDVPLEWRKTWDVCDAALRQNYKASFHVPRNAKVKDLSGAMVDLRTELKYILDL